MPPVLEIRNIVRNYQGLRPLRLRELTVSPGERVAISGLDLPAAEALVNLVTGASLPDEGDVLVLGASTSAIQDGDQWLASLDRFGIVSPRAVLLDGATMLQNLAMPFTLEIDPVPPSMVERVKNLAVRTGLAAATLAAPVAAASPIDRMRAHLARAIALDPALLVLEHPTATLGPADRRPFAEDVKGATAGQHLATLIISEDDQFSRVAADRRYRLNAATGDAVLRRRGFFG